MNVIFLDFDGVVRVPSEVSAWRISPYNSDFRADKFRLVLDAIKATQSGLVISSDWKDFGYELVSGILDEHGLLEYLHDDWATPRITSSGSFRHHEVQAWLDAHPNTEHYVILEDLRQNFEGCPPEMEKRIVWTNNRMGLQPEHFGEILEKMKL